MAPGGGAADKGTDQSKEERQTMHSEALYTPMSSCVEMEAPSGIQCLVQLARGRILASVNMDTVLWSVNVPLIQISPLLSKGIIAG